MKAEIFYQFRDGSCSYKFCYYGSHLTLDEFNDDNGKYVYYGAFYV